jgi:hypothetical protein
MTRAPMTATMEPIISYLSGFFLSTILPQIIEDTMKKMPPYAAYIPYQTQLAVTLE